MAFIARFILVVLCLLMFRVKRRTKFAILLLSSVCFSFVTLPMIPLGSSKYILSIFFLISELPYLLRHFKDIKKSIIGKALLIALILIIVQIVTSPHYNSDIKNIIKLFISDFFCKYLALGYAFVCIVNERDLRPTMKITFYGLLVLTFFGVINYITKSAEFINQLGEGIATTDITKLLGNKFTYSARFRVQAMFFNPFDYGYICIMLFILHWGGYLKGLLSRPRLYVSMVCCVFGIFTCGCRTVLVCGFVALIIYILFSRKLQKKITYLLCLSLVCVIAYSAVPYVEDEVDSVMSIFSKKSNIGGSSIEMRNLQYITVLKHIKGHEWFGRGKGYFLIDLGFEEGMQGLKDHNLYGLESVFFSLLLESGIVGVVFYLIIYSVLFYYSFKYRKVDKQMASLSISALVAYFLFATMTGELASVFPTLLIAGCWLSILYNKTKVHLMTDEFYATNSNNNSQLQ